MAHPLAVAAVTAVLRTHLRSVVGGEWTPELPRTHVSTLPLDHVSVTDQTGPIVNVVLWNVRVSAEARAGLPPAPPGPGRTMTPITVTYLVSAHGILPLESDILIGQVLSAILEQPVIPVATMKAALDPDADNEQDVITRVFRREAVRTIEGLDHVRLVCRSLSFEEHAAVWQSAGVPPRPSLLIEVSGVAL